MQSKIGKKPHCTNLILSREYLAHPKYIFFPESHELQAALLSSVVTSSLARPVALPWTVRALWLTSLLFGQMSLSLAAQQAIALTRISNNESTTHKIRHLLENLCPEPSAYHPSSKSTSAFKC
jgi:hypothetical protein